MPEDNDYGEPQYAQMLCLNFSIGIAPKTDGLMHSSSSVVSGPLMHIKPVCTICSYSALKEKGEGIIEFQGINNRVCAVVHHHSQAGTYAS
eukprot:2753711-Pyramimonas_sp.AAC.1